MNLESIYSICDQILSKFFLKCNKNYTVYCPHIYLQVTYGNNHFFQSNNRWSKLILAENKNSVKKENEIENGVYITDLDKFKKISIQEISAISLNRHAIEILVFIVNKHPNNVLMKDIAIGLSLNKNHLSKIIFDLLAKGINILYSIWFDLEQYFSVS